MKRNTKTRILACLGFTACIVPGVLAQGVSVEVNGQPVYFRDAKPQMIGGRVMVPLRGVLEQLGAYVDWDAGSRMVTARKGSVDIQLRIGDRTAMVNGRSMTLDSPAMTVQGSTMVPLRFMSEALGADVQWMAQTNTVRINTMDVSEPPNFPPYRPPTTTQPAEISSFSIDALNGILHAGDMVHLSLFGTAAADVNFSIPGVTGTKRMREESPGHYVADWTVPNEAEGYRATAVVAKLINGNNERTMHASGEVTNYPEPSRDRTPPLITAMEPANGANVNRTRPMIRARVSDANGSGLNLDSWRLSLDGADVTGSAGYSNGMITFMPENRLNLGTHNVQLTIEDKAGNRASQTWSFEVARDSQYDRANTSFTHDWRSSMRAGDVATFTLRAEPGARVTYSIGNTIVDRAMTESSPGVYTARYTVRRDDNFLNQPVVARVRLDDGTSYTVEADQRIDFRPSGVVSTPIITAPIGSRVGNGIIVRARSNNAARFEVKIEYASTILGGLRLTGIVHQRTYEANSRGELNTDEIDLTTPVGGSNTEYTITVTAIASDGTRSEPATLTVRK
jgi:hypothetical protein